MHQDLLQLLYGHCIPGLSFGACSFTVLFVAKPCKWPITLYYRTPFPPEGCRRLLPARSNAICGPFDKEKVPGGREALEIRQFLVVRGTELPGNRHLVVNLVGSQSFRERRTDSQGTPSRAGFRLLHDDDPDSHSQVCRRPRHETEVDVTPKLACFLSPGNQG